MSFYLQRVLDTDLAPWLALGWVEVGRTRPQSLPYDDVLIRWDGQGEPPRPQ